MTDSAWYLTYATSLTEVGWGIVLIAVTMMMHAAGMLVTLSASNVLWHRSGPSPGFAKGISVLVLASWMIVTVHLIEVVVWAAFFVWREAMPSPSVAYYYSLLQYTTVGSDLSLPVRWRLLGGMIAMAGLLTFAWSTTVLLTLAQRFQAAQLARMAERDGNGR